MKKRILSCFMALALCLTLLPATVLAEAGHSPHPICGQTCSHTDSGGKQTHPNDAFANATGLSSYQGADKLDLMIDDDTVSGKPADPDDATDGLLLSAGTYYLKSEVTIDKPIVIRGKVTICLNGKTLQSKAKNKPVFQIIGGELTLTDCSEGTGKVIHSHSLGGSGTGVQVDSGRFNLYGGAITKNTATTDDTATQKGGGVYVKSGTFNMYGGTITDNTASHGGGVYVEASGKFIMNNDASVTANTMGYGSTGGVGVYVNGGTFEMHDNASVKDNTTNNSKGSYGGGVYVTGNGTFEMHDNASVTGNKATGGTLDGGGVYVTGNGTFKMNGESKVTGNTAKNGGGVYVKVTGRGDNSGKFEMNGTSSVTGNTASSNMADQGNGGGVYVESGTFTMNDKASVSGNTATNSIKIETACGGGVYINTGRNNTFTMNDKASVTGNTAENGGGVYVNTGNQFNMNGSASVTGNIGNGVFVHDNATFIVSDKPTVTGNTKGSTDSAASNVYLTGSAKITIADHGLYGEKNSIGVTKGGSGVGTLIAAGAKKDYSGIFFVDNEQYKVGYDATENQLVLTAVKHTHIWSYQKVNDATITANCTGKGVCNVNNNGGSVTITKPDDLTQGSNGKTAKVTVSDDWQSPAKHEITITYWKSDDGGNIYTSLGGVVPTEAGKYKASITVEEQTAFVVYNIVASAPAKLNQEPLHLASDTNIIAVGEKLKLTVTGGSTDGGVTYHFTSGTGKARILDNVLTAELAGTVTFTATKDGNETYNDVTSDPITITITEKSGGTTPSQPGGSSSGDSGSSDSNPIIKTETKNNPDGSTTKTETRKDGSVTQTTTGKDGSVSKTETRKDGSSVTENKAADGSTGTVKTDKNGQTEASAKVSAKAVENAKKNGEPVKAPVEVQASKNSSTAPTVKVELPKGAGETKVEIPVSNVKSGTVAVLVHPDGTEEIVKNSLPTENGIQLTVNGGAMVKIVDNSKDFIDTRNHWAKDAIDFVSARELVNGMSATRYAPDASATRAQLWTILARQNDADLNGGNTWYEKAQLWSKDKGISDGTQPDATTTRAQIVTMMWRASGSPAAQSGTAFQDVAAGSYYAQAVAWAVENGITAGVGGGRFDPDSICTRAQIATFLAQSMK